MNLTGKEMRETIYLCCACGKRSNDELGYDPIDEGYDESCMLNAVLVYKDNLEPVPKSLRNAVHLAYKNPEGLK